MISGIIVLEDISIFFTCGLGDNGLMARWNICDNVTGNMETMTADQDKFLKALAIAMHNDGMPDYKADYPDAELCMGEIRWIP